MKQLNLLSKYRGPLMGVAILMIVFFHLPMEIPAPFSYMKKLCECGVDIFLLLSGFGLYSSLDKDSDTLSFYKRRAERLLPTYLPFIILWFAYSVLTANANPGILTIIKSFFGNIAMTGYLSGSEHQFNWYVQTIFWLYIFMPILFCIIAKGEIKDRNKRTAILFIFVVLINITFLGNEDIIISLSRIFIFVLGIIFADFRKRKEEVKFLLPTAIIFMAIGLILWFIVGTKFYSYRRILGLEWYPFFLIVPGLSMIICNIFEWISKNKAGQKFSSFIAVFGTASFEIYLIHITVNTIIGRFYDSPNYKLICIGGNVIAIISGIIYSKAVNYIFKKIKTLKNVKEN